MADNVRYTLTLNSSELTLIRFALLSHRDKLVEEIKGEIRQAIPWAIDARRDLAKEYTKLIDDIQTGLPTDHSPPR